jgi:hypothetical protein
MVGRWSDRRTVDGGRRRIRAALATRVGDGGLGGQTDGGIDGQRTGNGQRMDAGGRVGDQAADGRTGGHDLAWQ